MTRDVFQDTHRNILTVSNDNDMRTDDDLGNAHSKNGVLSLGREVCIPRGMTMSGKGTGNIMDSEDEVCERLEQILRMGTNDLSSHEVPTQTPERTTEDTLQQPTNSLGGGTPIPRPYHRLTTRILSPSRPPSVDD